MLKRAHHKRREGRQRKNLTLSSFVSFVVNLLRQSGRQPRQRLHQVVVDDHHREKQQEDKRRLVDAFLDLQADVASHHTFNQQQQDHATIEDWNRQKVEDSKIQADRCSKQKQRCPALLTSSCTGGLADANRSLNRPERDFAPHHLLHQLQNQHGSPLILFERAIEGGRERQPANLGGFRLNPNSIPLLSQARHI